MASKKDAQKKAFIKPAKTLKQVERRKLLHDLVRLALPEAACFSTCQFHGNTKWLPDQLAAQALIWSWQDTRNVTDAFEKTLEICEQLGLDKIAKTYTCSTR